MGGRFAAGLVAVAAAAAVAPFLPAYPLTLLTQAAIAAILAMSLDVLLGYTGLPSLGHAAYFGVAAYAVAILATERQAGFAVCMAAGLAAAVVAAAVFGLVAIRASGTYFLMITLALGMVVWGLAFRWVSLTKGDNGISGVPRPELHLPWSLWSPLPFFYFALAGLAVAWALLGLLVSSPFGLSLKGVRESEARMRVLGYNVWLVKYLAFVIAGGFAGLAGTLWAYYNGFVSPVDVQLVTSVEALLMVALGGPGTLAGPAVGAAVIVFLKNFASVYTKRWLLILGAVYIGVILFAPRGLAGALQRLRRQRPAPDTKEAVMRDKTGRFVALVILATLGVGLGLPWGAPAQTGPIKIGLLAPLSGAFSATGKDMLVGTELYLDEIGRTAAGRKIDLIVEDTEGTPAGALTKARKLVDQDRVHVLTGGLLASTGYALQPFVDGQRIPTTFPVIAADDLTQRKPARWIVRTGWATSQPMHPFGEYAATTLKHRKVVAIGMDYAFGWETVGGFQRSFEEAGGQIVQKIWTPLNTNDFAPFLAQVRRDADAVLALFVGRLALQFMKQYEAAGLKGKVPLLGGGTTTDESVLPQMGDEAIGAVTALHYSAALDTPQNRKFAPAFEARAGKSASYYSEATYTGTRWIVEAIKAVNGRVEDREALLAALRKVDMQDAPRGPIGVDQWGNPVQSIYVRRVDRVRGKLQNTVIATLPAVGQFWKYKADDYMKTPLYTRDYPPCKHCQ